MQVSEVDVRQADPGGCSAQRAGSHGDASQRQPRRGEQRGQPPNTLVELTPAGDVLDTKVVDKNKTAGIFGLYAIGKTDSDTALFYTDSNDNNLHELLP